MKLAALGYHYGWSRAELLALTAADIAFWYAAAAQFHAQQQEG